MIEIKKNVIEEALKKKGQKNNDPLDLLFQMAICAKKGYHVVLVPALIEDPKMRKDLAALMTEGNVNALCYAEERHRMDVGRLKREVNVSTVISYKREVTDENVIVINPLRESQFQPYTELYLLVENLIDADFYNIVLGLYRKEKGLLPYCCTMYPLMGGGVTTAKVMDNEANIKRHYCLAIADSDRKRPNGQKGQTANELLHAVGAGAYNCSVCCLEDLSEIENMIPRKVVRFLFPLGAGDIDILTKDPSFFDMKKGLHFIDLLDNKNCNYWRGLLPEKQGVFTHRDSLKSANPNNQDFERAMKAADQTIIPGFGVNLLKRVMDADNDAIPPVRQQNITANDLLHKTNMSDLNTFQQREWIRVGQYIFSWGCGMKAM